MIEVYSIDELRRVLGNFDGSTGFVPTMGALHSGHFSLIERSLSECGYTFVSIYLNPTQFDNVNDLKDYPDTLKDDLYELRERKVNVVFMPSYTDLYPDDFSFLIEETLFSSQLCGAIRPGHYRGVLTVVMKLLNLLKPDKAYFGEKDHQQLSLIKGMVEAFFIETEIIACPTIRETDGLAMSSRNQKLSWDGRKLASKFYQILSSEDDDVFVAHELRSVGFMVQYVSTIDGRRYGAVVVGEGARSVRLIDNVKVGEQ